MSFALLLYALVCGANTANLRAFFLALLLYALACGANTAILRAFRAE